MVEDISASPNGLLDAIENDNRENSLFQSKDDKKLNRISQALDLPDIDRETATPAQNRQAFAQVHEDQPLIDDLKLCRSLISSARYKKLDPIVTDRLIKE